MKRIAVAICLLLVALSGRVFAKSDLINKAQPQAVNEKKSEQTKTICTIGLGPGEDVDSYTEVFDTLEECHKNCRGIAKVCQVTAKETPVNLEELD